MKYVIILLCAVCCLGGLSSCNGQSTPTDVAGRQVGGACDGCELIFVGMPHQLYAADTGRGWHENGQRLLITGVVYQIDGKTPAAGVILYYWQTDQTGRYAEGAGMHEGAKKHGRLRGWVKTGEDGRYSIYTTRPAPYPNDKLPAHIHLLILEPQFSTAYYIDDLVFDDDPLLLPNFKQHPPENRGGSGVLRLLQDTGRQVAEHDIILGLHIPNYVSGAVAQTVTSGLQIGEDQPSFIPYHAY